MLYVSKPAALKRHESSVKDFICKLFLFSLYCHQKGCEQRRGLCFFFPPPNLVALQQRVQARDNWIPLLNSYISPNRIRLKKLISLNCNISVNVSKQNGTGFPLFYELIRVSYQ